MMDNENNEVHTCFTCEMSFSSRSDLVSHLDSHSESELFTCDFCEELFSSEITLKEHYESHDVNSIWEESMETSYSSTKKNAAYHVCNLCNTSYCTREDLNNHIIDHLPSVHKSEKPNQPKPNKGKRRGRSNKKPIPATSQEQVMEKYKCMVCEQTFRLQSKFRLHLQKHVVTKNFYCDVCDKTFSDQYILRDHMIAHSGLRPYVCDVCGRGFAWKPCLVVHRRKHTGEKPYRCKECEWAFPTNTHLKRHVAEIHSDEKPFECEVCSKAFSVKGRLQEHMKNHGDSPTLQALVKLGFPVPKDL